VRLADGEMSASTKNLESARSYLQAIEGDAMGRELKAYFAPEVEFLIFPNQLMPQGERRNLSVSLEGVERGRKLMAKQKYLIKNEIADDDRVALEVGWTGRWQFDLDRSRRVAS
jgi:glutamine synthetase